MKNILKILLILILSQLFISSSFIKNPLKKRWPVKTLSDKDTTLVNFKNIVKSSVHDQRNIKRPDGKLTNRHITETTIYTFDCYIVGFKKELDRDIHVIIKDINTGETMVAEIPNYKDIYIKKTSREKQFKLLRNWFVDNIGKPHSTFKMFNHPKLVTITGVGFWDTVHGQKGMAPNGREIHPILSMKFKS